MADTVKVQLRRFDRIGSLGGPYWVGMALPADHAADDYSMEEVTYRYCTRAALVAALAEGTAWRAERTDGG